MREAESVKGETMIGGGGRDGAGRGCRGGVTTDCRVRGEGVGRVEGVRRGSEYNTVVMRSTIEHQEGRKMTWMGTTYNGTDG